LKANQLIVIACICVFCLPLIVACKSDKPIDVQPANIFTSERWKQNHGYDREQCVFDLRNKHILEGCSKTQIKEILGQPDNEEHDTIWGYDMHSETASLKILLLIFENEKVTMIEIHENP
jgi:hypothetical protein